MPAQDNKTLLWPTPQDYNEAIQSPQHCFADEDLRAGQVETNKMGLPKAVSGAFASVYKVTTPIGVWAVRCLLSSRMDQGERYRIVSEYVLLDDLECTVDVQYIDKGIKVGGQWYPIVKMPWIPGPTLDVYIRQIANDKMKLLALKNDFYNLSMQLEDAGIAHGDLQHGNIIVSPDGLRLVDYDAFFVPALAGRLNLEFGHPNYQHPLRDEFHFDVTVDNFSSWLIYASLVALTIDPELFETFEVADDCILFRRTDLHAPENSPVFESLLNHQSDELRKIGNLLQRMLWLPPHIVPALNATKAELDGLPTEKPTAWNLQPLTQVEWQSGAPRTTNGRTSANVPVTAKKIPKKKQSVKEVAGGVLDSMLKLASPGLWVSNKTNQANRFIDDLDYEQALAALLQVRELQMHVFPDEKNLEMSILLQLAWCSINLDARNQASNYCMNAAQLAKTNSKLLGNSPLLVSPGLVMFFLKLSELLSAIARKNSDKDDVISKFMDLLSQGADLATTAESQKIMGSVVDLFDALLDRSVFELSQEELRNCAQAIIEYQCTWIRLNGNVAHMSDYAKFWRVQSDFAQSLAKRSGDKSLILHAAILSRACPPSMFAEGPEFMDSCFADEANFKPVLQKIITKIGCSRTMICFLPSLRKLATTNIPQYVSTGCWLWEQILSNEQEFLAHKIGSLSELDYDIRYKCLTEPLVREVLRQMKIEFGYERRKVMISEAIGNARMLGSPASLLVEQMCDKLVTLVNANRDSMRLDDLIWARQLLQRYLDAESPSFSYLTSKLN